MLKLGQSAQVSRIYSKPDLQVFATLSGAEAENVPEPLIAALFSYLLGVKLPGVGTNYLKQDLRFSSVAPLDMELHAKVEVIGLRPEKHLVDLWSSCHSANGHLICEGRSLVKARDVQGAFVF